MSGGGNLASGSHVVVQQPRCATAKATAGVGSASAKEAAAVSAGGFPRSGPTKLACGFVLAEPVGGRANAANSGGRLYTAPRRNEGAKPIAPKSWSSASMPTLQARGRQPATAAAGGAPSSLKLGRSPCQPTPGVRTVGPRAIAEVAAQKALLAGGEGGISSLAFKGTYLAVPY